MNLNSKCRNILNIYLKVYLILLILYALISSFPHIKIPICQQQLTKFWKRNSLTNTYQNITLFVSLKCMTWMKQIHFFREAQQRLYPGTTCMPGTRMSRIDNSQMNRKPAEPLPTITWQLTPTYNARQLISQILKTYFRNMLFWATIQYFLNV